jgi:MoxR-like ATPase
MDGRGVITIPGYRNERVQATDGFYVVAGHNPGVHGAVLTEALASRFRVHIHVLLYGPPGTGKTAMVEAAFPDLLTIAGTENTLVDDFVGGFLPTPDCGYEFFYGPLVVAMREGRALLVDDVGGAGEFAGEVQLPVRACHRLPSPPTAAAAGG